VQETFKKQETMIQGNIGRTKLLLKEVPKPEEKKTGAGLILLSTKNDPQIAADCIQCGEGLLPSIPMDVKVGERVLFYPHSAQRFNILDEPVILLDVRDVLFRFVPDPQVL
jgi:Chaperonin 10 Kd subunit.